MRRPLLIFSALFPLLWTGAARAESIKDPAQLVPATALAYGELRQPGHLAKEIASLFEDSVLGNLPQSLTRLHSKAGNPGMNVHSERLGVMTALLAPETVKELQRVQGAAAAWTGFDKQGIPEGVFIVLPGDSNLPGLVMRSAVAWNEHIKQIGEVEGIPLYREVHSWTTGRAQSTAPSERQAPPPPTVETQEAGGPALAILPEALLIGTPDAIKDVIHRIKGKGKTPSLATSKTFQEASKQIGVAPGLFTYASASEVLNALEHHAKLGHGDKQALSVMQDVVNFRALRAVATGYTLDKGTFRCREIVLLNPDEQSPLLEVLPTAAVDPDLLQFAPANAVFAAAVSNADGARRWTRLLELADKVAKDTGSRQSPGEAVRQVQNALGLDIGKDIMAKVSAAAFAVGDPFKAPIRHVEEKGPGFRRVEHGPEVPMLFIVRATDEDAAKSLANEVLPKLVGLVTGDNNPQPAVKEIDGQKIRSIPVKKGEALHYGRHGKTIVLGPYADPVAKALRNAKEQGLLSDKKLAARIKKRHDPVALVVLRPFTLPMAWFMALRVSSEGHQAEMTGTPAASPKIDAPPLVEPAPPPPPKPVAPRERRDKSSVPPAPPAPPRPPAPVEIDGDSRQEQHVAVAVAAVPAQAEEEPLIKELGKLLESEEPLLLSVSRRPDEVQIDTTLPGLKPLVARLTDFLLEQSLKSRTQRYSTAPPARQSTSPKLPGTPPRPSIEPAKP